jgi:hypothetical protein
VRGGRAAAAHVAVGAVHAVAGVQSEREHDRRKVVGRWPGEDRREFPGPLLQSNR